MKKNKDIQFSIDNFIVKIKSNGEIYAKMPYLDNKLQDIWIKIENPEIYKFVIEFIKKTIQETIWK